MPLSNIQIVHRDAALLVIDKPTLLLSVPGRAEDNRDCPVTRLQENGYPEARIVHRPTGKPGLIVLARDADSHRELSRQFHDRETEKAYTALCWASWMPTAAASTCRCYDPPTKPRHVVDHELGKHALTFWRVLERCGDYSRVELTPITGRFTSCGCTCCPPAIRCSATASTPTSRRCGRTSAVPACQHADPDPSADRRAPAFREPGTVLRGARERAVAPARSRCVAPKPDSAPGPAPDSTLIHHR